MSHRESPHVEVFGVDHSPWVQAVLLGLQDRGIPHSLTSVPPLAHFLRFGILMPAARIGGAPWQLDSYEILEQVGYQPVSSEDLSAIYGAWRGVANRVDEPFRFWREFSYVRDSAPRLLPRLRNHFLRSFATFHFFLLIHFMRRTLRAQDSQDFGDGFRYWEQKLAASDGEYLAGREPDILDMLLFGIIQCHCSIPVPPIRALQEDPELGRLRSWIGAMQRRLADYPHLYSGVYFSPHAAAPERSSRMDQAAFWAGAAFMFLAFPVTIPLVVLFASRAQKLRRRSSATNAS